MRDGVADPCVAHLFDGCGQEADFAGAKRVDHLHLWAEDADLVNAVHRVVGQEFDLVALFQTAINDADQNDNAEVAVVPRVDQHRFEVCIFIALGCGQIVDDGFEGLVDASTGFGRGLDGVFRLDPDDVFDLFGDPCTIGGRQVDLVQDRDDFVVGV